MSGENASQSLTVEEIVAQTKYRDDSVEVIFADQRRVVCDGPGGVLGHPRVWYTIGDRGYAECGYCDRVFILDKDRAGARIEGHVPPALPGDGISASAMPKPGEVLNTGGDSGA